jgi:fatty-acyl-CoA synthase
VITIPAVLDRNRRLGRDHLAVIDDRDQLTHGELADRAAALAGHLLERGLEPGEPVAVLGGNGVFIVEAFCGVVAAGGLPAMLNWRWAPPELAHAIAESGARTVLVEDEMREPAAAALAGRGFAGGGPTMLASDDLADLAPNRRTLPSVSPDDPAVMLFTGGTTGESKGVVLSHANVMANCINEIVDTDMDQFDVTLCVTPMHHSASLLCWFLPHLVLGATTVLQRYADEERSLELIDRYGVTNTFMVPTMVRRLLASGLLQPGTAPTLSRVYVGGAPFTMPDKLAMRDALPRARLYYQYGLTEAGPIVTRLRPEQMFDPALDGSIGHEFLLTDVAIRDGHGQPVADGQPGELCVRGPNVMIGYHRRPDATAAVLADGWLRTGDIGSRGPHGELWFLGREKELIKSGGENVFASEVEQALLRHPSVSEAAVVGWSSDEWDEEVRAIVVLRSGDDRVDERALRDHCRGLVAGYKVPKRIAIVADGVVPVSATGKILKRELRETFVWP